MRQHCRGVPAGAQLANQYSNTASTALTSALERLGRIWYSRARTPKAVHGDRFILRVPTFDFLLAGSFVGNLDEEADP